MCRRDRDGAHGEGWHLSDGLTDGVPPTATTAPSARHVPRPGLGNPARDRLVVERERIEAILRHLGPAWTDARAALNELHAVLRSSG